jgi:hypothetical protein
MDNIVMKTFIVTCHTHNCENSEIAISIDAPETNSIFICGACSKDILDVVG